MADDLTETLVADTSTDVSNETEVAVEALTRTAAAHGGRYREPDEYQGSVARTMFDAPNSEDDSVIALIAEEDIPKITRGSMVRVASYDRKERRVQANYVGQVISGPFAIPDAMRSDSAQLVLPAVNHAMLTPRFHGMVSIEVFGVEEDGQILPPMRRPIPNSPVFLLEPDHIRNIMGVDVPEAERPFTLGLMDGAAEVEIRIPALRKAVLPKHTAALGTTGAGKSTTIVGFAAKLGHRGHAVIILDVEGEYTTMNEPADNPGMLAALRRRGQQPAGARNTVVYCLEGRDPANPNHPALRTFKLGFDQVSIYVLSEILELTDAQLRRFEQAYEITKVVMDRTAIFPANQQDRTDALEIDELDRGWPRMTLQMLIDVVSGCIAHVEDKIAAWAGPWPRGPFGNARDEIVKAIARYAPEKNPTSWKALNAKLWRIKRADLFSDTVANQLRPSDLLHSGQISIIDLKNMDSPLLRNIVIAQVLRGVQVEQDATYTRYEAALREGRPASMTFTTVFIEEAHEFLSAARIAEMPNLFDQVARIARRGRKRYLGLVFSTQFPGHLPREVLSLVNNWILLKITDHQVVAKLKEQVPMVDDVTWRSLKNFAPGQAVTKFEHMKRAVRTVIDPAPCKLRMDD
jgi:Helicase HerA, central domain